MATYSISATPSGSKKSNEATRKIGTFLPYDASKYCTVKSITRTNGAWCKTGSSSGTVTMYVKMQVCNETEVLAESETVSGKSHGSGPTSDNYMTTTIDDISQEVSDKIVEAWKKNQLYIKWVLSSSSSNTPYCRSGYYNDTITITGEDVNFRPWISGASMYRADSTGAAKDNDLYVGFSCTVGVGEVGDNGSGTLTILKNGSVFYKQTGIAGSTTGVQLALSPIGTAEAYQQKKGEDVYYTLTFTYTATKNGTTKTDSISTTAFVAEVFTNVHLAGVKTGGVRLGAYSTSTLGNPKFECDYPIYAYGGFGQLGQYSTEETATGMLWVDGSMIYRKAVEFTSFTKGGWVNKNISASGTIDTVTAIYGTAKYASGQYPIPYPAADAYMICVNASGNPATSVGLYVGASLTLTQAWVIVEYTLESLDTETLASIDDMTLKQVDIRTLK